MFKQFPVEFMYAMVAVGGGVARYLNGYVDGKKFSLPVFIASAVMSGFSGWMFALVGESMQFPQTFLFVMAGVGGFFGEQTMKLILEITTKKLH